MNQFTEEEVRSAKSIRDKVVEENIPEISSIYMAGEICMWDESQSQTPSPQSADNGWIKPEPDSFIDGELYHFLVGVNNIKTKQHYWEIITGYIDDSGGLKTQCNDEDSGWMVSDVSYFKHIKISDLPPLP